MLNRGRPAEVPAKIKEKFELETFEFTNTEVRDQGESIKYFYDLKKSKSGPYKVETTFPKGYKNPKVKADKSKAYANQPVVMVYKTSNRSNAKTKMKVFTNQNIDYILSCKSLPGVPDSSIILDLGVGQSMISKFESKYNL